MGLFNSLAGMLDVEVTSADISGFLSTVCNCDIPIFFTEQTGDLTLRFQIYRKDYTAIKDLAVRRGERFRLLRKKGVYWTVKRLLQRPLLAVGLLLIFVIAMYLPSRVLFIRVEGNVSIPTKLIIEQAETCGICFGASRREVRSEKMKNSLLAAVPELQWAGVNTYGCIAVISVEERTIGEPEAEKYGVCSIIAARDGIVESCTVTKGNALCKTGQAVKAGEVLVSGYTDLGIRIQATQAEAEIYASTVRELKVISPINYSKKGNVERIEKKYCLLIGKKRINFYKGSGISDTTCDKMYSVYYLTLPGGFQLPIAIGVEQWVVYDHQTIETAVESSEDNVQQFAESYLQSQMISGQITQKQISAEQTGEVYNFYGQYNCLEMIGRVRSEEIVDNYGKSD